MSTKGYTHNEKREKDIREKHKKFPTIDEDDLGAFISYVISHREMDNEKRVFWEEIRHVLLQYRDKPDIKEKIEIAEQTVTDLKNISISLKDKLIELIRKYKTEYGLVEEEIQQYVTNPYQGNYRWGES